MLIKDPSERPSAGDLLSEPLISNYVKVNSLHIYSIVLLDLTEQFFKFKIIDDHSKVIRMC